MSPRRGPPKPTPAPLNGEATKPTRNAKKKRKERRSIHKGQEKRQGKPPPYHLKGGAGRECVDEKAKRGGARPRHHRKRKNKESHSPVPQSALQKYPDRPRLRAGGIGRTKKERTRETDSPVPQFNGPITQATARY